MQLILLQRLLQYYKEYYKKTKKYFFRRKTFGDDGTLVKWNIIPAMSRLLGFSKKTS